MIHYSRLSNIGEIQPGLNFMNNNWKTYLLENGATQDNDGLFVFSNDYYDSKFTDNNDIICDLSHFSTMVIAGPDAAEFMQGQFTNDVKQVDDHNSQISGFCNNKGRLIANFRLFSYQQNYFISISNDLVERSIAHLQNYVLRAQVAIQDVSEQLIHIGVYGNNAESLLQPFHNELNTRVNSVSCNEDYIIIRVPGDKPRYEVFCSLDKAKSLWDTISQQATTVDSAYWNYLNIKNGLPFVDNHTSEEFVPQMANMDLIDGISFKKGCYTGQEIVARTHYLGKQKRRTYRLGISSATRPQAGEQLATETSTDNQYTGTLITVYPVAENTYEALAVIQIQAAEQGKLKLKDAEAEISLLKLPYSFE